MKVQIASLFDNDTWVNQHRLESASGLTAGQFARKVLPDFGSLHLTWVHMLGTEVLWLAHWQELSPTTVLSSGGLPTVKAIRDALAELVVVRRTNLVGLDEAQVAATEHWTNIYGQSFVLPRWQMMLH